MWHALAVGFQCKIFGFDCGCCLYAAFAITNRRVHISANRKGTEKKNAKIVNKVDIKEKKIENFSIHHSKWVIIFSVLTEKCVSYSWWGVGSYK